MTDDAYATELAELRREEAEIETRAADLNRTGWGSDDYSDFRAAEQSLSRAFETLECRRAGTHDMVYHGATSLSDDPPYSQRDVYGCDGCGADSLGFHYF